MQSRPINNEVAEWCVRLGRGPARALATLALTLAKKVSSVYIMQYSCTMYIVHTHIVSQCVRVRSSTTSYNV